MNYILYVETTRCRLMPQNHISQERDILTNRCVWPLAGRCLTVVDMSQGVIEYYDSMAGDEGTKAERVMKAIER